MASTIFEKPVSTEIKELSDQIGNKADLANSLPAGAANYTMAESGNGQGKSISGISKESG